MENGDTQLDEGMWVRLGEDGSRIGHRYDIDFHVTFIVHVSYYVTRPCKARDCRLYCLS